MGILTYIVAIAILIIVLKILTLPIKIIIRFIINSIIGGVILFVLAKIGIFVVLTWWMVVLVGVFGVPGVILAVILSFII